MNPLLLVAAAAVLFLLWRKREADAAAAALGRPPAPGGADGSPQSQVAARRPPPPSGPSFETAVNTAYGAGVCTAVGAGAVAGACGKVAAKVLPEVYKPRYILGRGPMTQDEIRAGVLNQGVTDLGTFADSHGTKDGGHLTVFAEIALRELSEKPGWSGQGPQSTTAPPTVVIKDNHAQGDPWLTAGHSPPTSIGGWVATGPKVQTRSGRGHF